jgi:hypothetical protein
MNRIILTLAFFTIACSNLFSQTSINSVAGFNYTINWNPNYRVYLDPNAAIGGWVYLYAFIFTIF